MQLAAVVLILAGLIATYFMAGILLSWLWSWWILIIAIPAGIAVGLTEGWLGALAGLAGVTLAIGLTDRWQGTTTHDAVADAIERMFHFGDT